MVARIRCVEGVLLVVAVMAAFWVAGPAVCDDEGPIRVNEDCDTAIIDPVGFVPYWEADPEAECDVSPAIPYASALAPGATVVCVIGVDDADTHHVTADEIELASDAAWEWAWQGSSYPDGCVGIGALSPSLGASVTFTYTAPGEIPQDWVTMLTVTGTDVAQVAFPEWGSRVDSPRNVEFLFHGSTQ